MRGNILWRRFFLIFLGVAGFLALDRLPAFAVSAIAFSADDGVVVHGSYTSPPSPKALILLFHQAGSSKAEYATIAPMARSPELSRHCGAVTSPAPHFPPSPSKNPACRA